MNQQRLRALRALAIIAATLAACTQDGSPIEPGTSFAISYPESVSGEQLDGRLILVLAKNDTEEPRFQVAAGVDAAQVFGMNVDGMAPDVPVVLDETVFGYPHDSLADLPEGEYFVQALLHKYDTFTLANGKTVKLPMDQGEGQQWNRSPGNLYSEARTMHVGPGAEPIRIVMDRVVEPIAPPADTEFVKHIRIRSELLSEFWGRDMYLGAHVLLPAGFDEHPEARYPLAIWHGHFPADFAGFSAEPPDADLECQQGGDVPCYNRIRQQEAYDFYQQWTGPDFPRMLIVQIQHQNPYYDDSYAVNSANVGPYGDAITYELIPYIEEQFRGIGEGWARFLYGGSTGGWESFAVQVFYPDEYNGTFAACPDSLDFRFHQIVNIYDDDNAYRVAGDFNAVERPAFRDFLGNISVTMEDENHMELVLGDKSRSGGQWDIWEAVFSPMGEDGYPQRIWDKRTGVIDHEVAAYWRENYDMRHILQRDWETLGPKLEGKLHVMVGDMDNFYLNNAVYLLEEFLESTSDPHYGGSVDYGDRQEHCWNGDHDNPLYLSRLRYNTMYVPKILERLLTTAPDGADLSSWRY
ncbi:MAG: hypothetical protein OEV41_01140 [Gammaproteobacteria bacterium]|nr:hypothetical protein [Gammaproteobacteria bacterium]MDH5344261.1 hypothetical protein [Gammaproteobacteria bacterium]